MAITQLYDAATLFLFALEFYHAVAHIMIMCGIRTLPRKDLVKIKYYFLVDCLTVFVSSFVVTGKMRWLASMHLVQHLFYFATWDNSHMAKKIINWSSLEWFYKKDSAVELDSTLGTLFDIVVHVVMMYVLVQGMDMTGIVLAAILSQAALFSVIFNPRFAWSSPSNIKPWVKKRLNIQSSTLPAEQKQE